MLLRGLTDTGCVICFVDSAAEAPNNIFASVGTGGVNRHGDVLAVQRLLNGVAPGDGGPFAILVEDGVDGPITNAAILRFQTTQNIRGRFGGEVRDDRIDPSGPTMTRLKEISTPQQRATALKRAGAVRLLRTAQIFPRLHDAAHRAKFAAESAMDFLRLGSHSLFGPVGERNYRRADLYFRFGRQPTDQTLFELSFIRTTIERVASVLVKSSPFGLDIFDVDPHLHPVWMAYSPMQTGAENRHDGTTPLRVYLCDHIDLVKSDDLFAHILVHELFHFVDDETRQSLIVDAPHGYRDGAMRLTHEQRMHNADNYALFVTHTAIGRARLVASQPTLMPFVPADMP